MPKHTSPTTALRVALALLSSTLVLGACSNGASSGDDGGSTSGDATEITFLLAEGPEELETFQEIGDAYNASRSDVHVTLVPVGEDEDLVTRLSTDVASGNAPDVFFTNYRYVDSFVSKGLLAPITEQLASTTAYSAKDFYPVSMDAYKIGGQQYCMPFNASSLVVYYNEKLFEEAGLEVPSDDWTWKEMLNDAKALTGLEPVEGGATAEGENEEGDGGEGDGGEAAAPETPTSPQPGDDLTSGVGIDPQFIRLMPLVWSGGGEVANAQEDPTRLTMTTEPGWNATDALLNLARQKVVPSEALYETEGMESLFLNGRLGMLFESRKVVPSLRTITGFEWDVAPMPRLKDAASILHSDGYCISQGSEHQAEAWKFIEFATGERGQEIAAETGRAVPSMISVAGSDAFLDPSAAPSRSQVFLDQIPETGRVPVIANWVEVEDTVNTIIEEGFFEGADTGEVVEEIDRQTKPLLAEG